MADTLRHRKKRAFLAAYAELGNVRAAAKAAKVGRADHYRWLEHDPAYVAAFKAAEEEAIEALEEEARRRAVQGVEEGVYYQGERVDTIRKFSDVLLIFLLKAARPEVYRERASMELTGSNGEPLRIVVENGFKVPGAAVGEGTNGNGA